MESNILVLICDALRFDMLEEMPTLSTLADEGLTFTNAHPPSHWSLPSHVSIFTGTNPPLHGTINQTQYAGETPLVRQLSNDGYDTYAFSSNVYFSKRYGFDRDFDRFDETHLPLSPKGLDTYENVRRRRGSDESTLHSSTTEAQHGKREYLLTLYDSVSHKHPVSSLVNFGKTSLLELQGKGPMVSKLPFSFLKSKYRWQDASRRNTERLCGIFGRYSGKRTPFFIVANDMNTHIPYNPPEEFLPEGALQSLSYYERRDMSQITNHYEFLDRVGGAGIDEHQLELGRDLYRGEARTLDAHIKRLLKSLDDNNLREETLIIVTSDHGEMLGETDQLGERRMGHLPAVSEHLLRIPLVISHPDIEQTTVDTHFSLAELNQFLTVRRNELTDPTGDYAFLGTEREVIVELPRRAPQKDNYERYEHIPDRIAKREYEYHTVVGYFSKWQVVISSSGEEYAWEEEEQKSISEAPELLVESCKSSLESLLKSEPASDDIELSAGV